ncbi:MAG: DNA recombination protein RmuC [Bacteroidales bacterium]|nr:DNA recombination protein RmuC [Bacteroidales bacterium]
MEQILFIILGMLIGFFIGKILSENKLKFKFQNQEKILENQLNEAKIKIAELNAERAINDTAQVKMKDTFEALASDAMRKNNESFIHLAKETMNGFMQKADNDISKKADSISTIIKPLAESLEKHEKLITAFQNGNNQAIGSLKSYMEELSKSQKSLEKETGALVTALKSPKVRGRWGEIGLKRIVEFSGMSHYCDFDEQVNKNTDDGALRPDMIVNLPENRKIIVDSKMPLNAYLDALEAEEELTKQELMKNHAKAVALHVKNLSAKAYWSQFDNSIDFVVLYIEVESAFSAALSVNPRLIVEGLQNKIVFATPTTLITMLQTVAYSWKQQKSGENAQQIIQSSHEVFERIAIFNEYIQKIGTNISSLVKTFNQSVGSWEGRVLPSIRKVEALGLKSENRKIESLEKIESSVRKIENQ